MTLESEVQFYSFGMYAVCDDTCRETVLDPSNELLVCTVSGRCFDRWLTPAEEDGAEPVSNLFIKVELRMLEIICLLLVLETCTSCMISH